MLEEYAAKDKKEKKEGLFNAVRLKSIALISFILKRKNLEKPRTRTRSPNTVLKL